MKLNEESEAFVATLETGSVADFQAYIDQHQSRAEAFDFKEVLQALPKKLLPRLCKGLLNQVNLSLTALHAVSDVGPGQEEQVEDEQASAADALRGAAVFALIILQENPAAPAEGLTAVAERLHDEALLMVAHLPELQLAVVKLCTAWWQGGFIGKEALIAQTLPFLLVKALSSGKAADVKQCHMMRSAFPLLDFEDESIGDLKRLLLRAAFSPAFLRPAEGRRFLSCLFNLQAQLVRELGAIVRNQVPGGRKSVLDAYGDVLQRAWRDSTGVCLLEVENLIQGLMQAAILASTPAMSAALRRLLDGLHGQKAHAPMESLLLRLYEPILFRGLSAANPAVRRNALLLLFDAFPLQDPEADNKVTDELLTRQFAAIGSCLGDAAPAVRCAAVTGICGLLNTYWELIPAATIAGFLKRLTGDLAFDGSSSAVRAAVLNGMALLVENPIAQPLLKVLLPHLGPSLWDAAPKVRVAFTDLLLCIQRVRALSVAELVSPDVLLEALRGDVPAVTQRIQRLLLPSYLPNAEEGPALVAYLLRTSPSAGKAFCRCLAGSDKLQGPLVPLEDLEALAVALRDHLLASAPAANTRPMASKARRGKRKNEQEEPQQAPADAEEEEETPESWQAILEGLAEICIGIAAITSADDEAAVHAESFKEGQLLRLLDLAQDCHQGREAVLTIATALRDLPAAVEVQARCMEEVAKLGPATPGNSIPHLVRCAMAGAKQSSLLETLLAALRLSPEEASDSGHTGPSKAGQVMDAMLREDETRGKLLEPARAVELLEGLLEAAKNGCVALSDQLQAEAGTTSCCSGTAPALSALGKAALHLHLLPDHHAASGPPSARTPADDVVEALRLRAQQADNALAQYLELAERVLDNLASLSQEHLHRLSEQAGEAETPKKKRSKTKGKEALAVVPATVSAFREAWQVGLCSLALFSDAAQLVSGFPLAMSACAYAQRLLEWVISLPATILHGSLFSSQNPAADAVAHAMRLACLVIANQAAAAAEEGARNLGPSLSVVPLTAARTGRIVLSELGRQETDSEATVPQPGAASSADDGQLSALVTAVMEATVGDEAGRVRSLRPFLSRLLEGVRSEPYPLADPRWIAPVASAVGAEVLQLRSEMGGDPEAPTSEGGASPPQPEQDENVDTSQPPEGRDQAAGKAKQNAVTLQQPLAKALFTAANSAKVAPECAGLAARAALEAATAQQATALLGALHLTTLFGFKGTSVQARRHNRVDADTAATLAGVQEYLSTNFEDEGDTLAVTCAKLHLREMLALP